jgi:predicted pyridoxine 5'-phosphate oxidase superfamily flavin-nucleotide-binding protein
MTQPSSDVAFTPAVKALQTAHGSRGMYARMEAGGGFRTAIDARLQSALAEANSAYFVTASATGQPYAQHRGGPRGFLRVIGENTIGFADYVGNRQYITSGNLAENPQAFVFLMDYAHRRRIKIWGRARVVDDDPALLARLMPEGYTAHPEAAIVMDITAWDLNCPQHIPQKFDADMVSAALAERDAEIARLRAEIEKLHSLQGETP